MVKFITAVLPCESVDVQVIVVVPYPNSVVEDDAGTGWPSFVQAMATLTPSSASTASLALAEYGTTAPAGLVPCTTLAGAAGLKAIVGAAVSKMSKRSAVRLLALRQIRIDQLGARRAVGRLFREHDRGVGRRRVARAVRRVARHAQRDDRLLAGREAEAGVREPVQRGDVGDRLQDHLRPGRAGVRARARW